MTTLADDNDLDVSLLEHYCADTASIEEAARIEAWFRGYPDQRVWYEKFKTALKKDHPLMSEEKVNAALAEFLLSALQGHPAYDGDWGNGMPSDHGTVDLAGRTPPEYLGHRPGTGPETLQITRKKEGVFSGRTVRREGRYALAGAIVGALMIVTGWHVGRLRLGTYKRSSISTYTTGNGERAKITLPDGSLVALNVASRLDVPTDYGAGNHTVRLSGEALFTVARQDGMPFTVMAGSATTRVLGTSFVVRHYATDSTTVVAVRDGKVAVGATVVAADRLVEVGRDGGPHIRLADASQFTFATGTLTLTGIPLPAAIRELDRWYDADIRLGDSTLAGRHIRGEFATGSLGELTAILEMTFNVRVVRDGRVLTLYPIG